MRTFLVLARKITLNHHHLSNHFFQPISSESVWLSLTLQIYTLIIKFCTCSRIKLYKLLFKRNKILKTLSISAIFKSFSFFLKKSYTRKERTLRRRNVDARAISTRFRGWLTSTSHRSASFERAFFGYIGCNLLRWHW